jgi:hypothetical protein
MKKLLSALLVALLGLAIIGCGGGESKPAGGGGGGGGNTGAKPAEK